MTEIQDSVKCGVQDTQSAQRLTLRKGKGFLNVKKRKKKKRFGLKTARQTPKGRSRTVMNNKN